MLDLADLASVREFASRRGRCPRPARHPGQQRRGDDAASSRRPPTASSFSSAPITSATSRSPGCCSTRSRRGRRLTGRHRYEPRAPSGEDRLRRPRLRARVRAPARRTSARSSPTPSSGSSSTGGCAPPALPVISVLAHPGYSATNLQSSGPTGAMKALLKVGNALLAQGADQGALPQLYAATAAGVAGRVVLSARTAFDECAGRADPSCSRSPGPRRGPRPSPLGGLGGAHRRRVSRRGGEIAVVDVKRAWAGSGCRRRSPSSPRATGTRSSSAAGTTGSPPPPTWPAPAARCSCSSAASSSAAPARSSARSPTSAT